MSSRAYLVDLIHSIGEKTALEDHLIEKLPDHPELKELIEKVADLRRSLEKNRIRIGGVLLNMPLRLGLWIAKFMRRLQIKSLMIIWLNLQIILPK